MERVAIGDKRGWEEHDCATFSSGSGSERPQCETHCNSEKEIYFRSHIAPSTVTCAPPCRAAVPRASKHRCVNERLRDEHSKAS